MDLKPRDIITNNSWRNAMVIVMDLGGSTNSVLHLIAIAWSVVGLHSTLDDFQKGCYRGGWVPRSCASHMNSGAAAIETEYMLYGRLSNRIAIHFDRRCPNPW